MGDLRDERRAWLAVLAQTPRDALEQAWRQLGEPPAVDTLRPAEIGLVMVRGRMGGTGRRFNLGETTVTRCAVRLPCGTVGHGYVMGRDLRKAELVAMLDAVLRTGIGRALIEPLAAALTARRGAARAKAAATRVEFFTMVRGDA